MKKISVFLLILLLVGCSAKPPIDDDVEIIQPTKKGDYPVALNFESSSKRNYSGTYLGSYDIHEIGYQLIEKSKKHFSTDDYTLQEGQVLTLDRFSPLVRRESPNNPQGLNPASGSTFDIGDGTILEDPVLVADIVEINFLKPASDGMKIQGISLAIVFNQVHHIETSTSVTTYTISNDRMLQYASDVGRKLESYLRTLNEVGDIPIYIGLYTTASKDAVLPGNYIAEGYFVSRSGQFSKLNEYWMVVPSNEATQQDALMVSFFSSLRSTLQQMLPESTGVMGKAFYKENEVDYLKVDIQMVAKTYMEIHSTIYQTASLLGRMEKPSLHVRVEIKSLGTTVAVLEKKANQNNVTIVNLAQ